MISNNLSISVCIATHERSQLLASTLDSIACQTRLPDEIVISDSSQTDKAKQVVTSFQVSNPYLLVKHVPSECRALPWHRWNAFQHSTGQIVFFLDDDIKLAPTAMQIMERKYLELFKSYGVDAIAGVGFLMTLPDGTSKQHRPTSFENHWLNITCVPAGRLTAGGLVTPLKSLPNNSTYYTDRLSGGAMSFRRDVLRQIGLLGELVKLYEFDVGRGEDAVISYYAHKYGNLYILTAPLVFHDFDKKIQNVAYSVTGWKKGLAETWGRAHTMRWMASDKRAYRYQWFRVATLEILRSIWWEILRKPFSKVSWSRLAGGLYGFFLTLWKWNTIPPTAR